MERLEVTLVHEVNCFGYLNRNEQLVEQRPGCELLLEEDL